MNDTIIQVNPDLGRYKLSVIKDWIKEKLGIEDPRLMGDYLRLSEKLSSTKNIIEIGVKTSDNADYVLDKKLATEDVFFITHLAVMISKEVTGEEGNAIMLPYPDTKIFKNVGEAKALNTVYNGKLALTDAHDRRFYDYYMMPFMKVPQLQVNTDGGGEITQYPNLSLDDSLVDWNPFEVVSGLAVSKFELRLGAGVYTAISDSNKNRVTIIAKGFKGSGLAAAYNAYAKANKG